jgi:hypothetical protein
VHRGVGERLFPGSQWIKKLRFPMPG